MNVNMIAKGLILLLLFSLAACGSDDDANGGSSAFEPAETTDDSGSTFEAADVPRWEVDMRSDQEKPQWTPPTPRFYENKMILMLRLQEELVPYSTDDDVMAVFIDDECRALSRRSGDGETIYFVLNIYGNPSSDPKYFLLCYYSGGLRQKFVLKDEIRFLNEKNLGTEGELVLDLLSGTTKYAWQTEIIVKPRPKEGIAIDSDADLVGVFVDGECRGKGKPGMPFYVFQLQEVEQAQLRYYSSSKGGIFTRTAPLTLNTGNQTIDFDL